MRTRTATILFLVLIALFLSSINTSAQPPYREGPLKPNHHSSTNNNQINPVPRSNYANRQKTWVRYLLPKPNYHSSTNNIQTPSAQPNNNAYSETLQSVYDRWFKVNVYAVIVGVSNYINSQHNLRYPASDAYCFYDFLTSDIGGNIPSSHIELLLNENATLAKIKLAMNSVFQNAGPNDVIYFYFSGHGGEEGYFLTYDEQPLVYSLIDNSFNLSNTKNKICIADAYFAGDNKKVKTTSLSYGLGILNSEPSMPKLISSNTDEVSIEYRGLEHGIFTYYLIEGLKGVANINGDDIITITELFNYVKSNVEKYTEYRQNPVLNGISDTKMPMAVFKQTN